MSYCLLKSARSGLALLLPLIIALAGITSRGVEQRASGYFQEGLLAIRRGAYEEAEHQVETGLRLDPNSPVGYDLLGIAYNGLGRYQDSQKAFEQALKLDPTFIPARNDFGRTLYRNGEVQEAAEQFRRALRIDPKNFTANYNLGIILLEAKKYQAAAKQLEIAGLQAPNDPLTLLALAKADFGAGERDRALAVTRELVSLNPSDPAIRFSLGTLFLEWRRYQESAQQLEFARLADPKNYETLYDLGQAYIHLTKYSEAEDAFLQALEVRSDSIEALYQLGVVYAQSGHPDQAIEILMRDRELAPTRPEILLLLGRECVEEGFLEDAVEVLQHAVSLDPGKVEPHLLLGEALTRNKQFPRALMEYEQVAQLDPSNPQSYVLLGRTLWYMTRRSEAEQNLRRAVQLDPGSTEAAYYLGLFAGNQGNFALAERWLGRVLKSNPNHFGAVYEMGAVCMKEQDYARAQDYLERAKNLSPKFSQTYYRLAAVYRHLGDQHRAAEEIALFKKYDALDTERRASYPEGVLELLKETQNLSERERLERYRQALARGEEKKPDDVNVLLMLANIDLKLGERQEALEQLNKICSLRPDDIEVAMRSASLLADFDLYPEATQPLEALLRKHPDAIEIRMALGSLYYTLYRDSDALRLLGPSTGVQSEPAAATHDLRGRIWSREGNSSKALEEFERALHQESQNEDYVLDCASELAFVGRMEPARKLIENAKAHMPTSGKILFAQGVWYQLAGHPKQALKSFQDAADLSWRWEAPYLAQGSLLRQNASYSRALEVLDTASSLFQSSPWPHWLRTLILVKDGIKTRQQAAAEFARSVKLAQTEPNAYPVLLVSSLQKKDCTTAAEIWTKMTALAFSRELDPSQWCSEWPKPDSPMLLDRIARRDHSELRLLVELARDNPFPSL